MNWKNRIIQYQKYIYCMYKFYNKYLNESEMIL